MLWGAIHFILWTIGVLLLIGFGLLLYVGLEYRRYLIELELADKDNVPSQIHLVQP